MSPLTKDEQRFLLEWARRAIGAGLAGGTRGRDAAPVTPPETLRQPGAAFVTLHARGALRGCVGTIRARTPLYQAVAEAAVSAALHDPRFPPLEADELPALEIEISVLSPMFPLEPGQVKPGEHGLLISDGYYRGLLLPQVASEHGWSREQFLEETCLKAGLDREAWKRGAKLEAFTAFVFSEANVREPEPSTR